MTAASRSSLARRGYPGWRMVWALAVTETISFGVLYYSFAAFLLPMQHALGSSQTTLTGAFSVSVLVTGAAAVPAAPEAWLELVLARIRVGPARSPWTAMGALSLSGERIVLGGLGRRPRVDARPDRLTADVRSPGARLQLQ